MPLPRMLLVDAEMSPVLGGAYHLAISIQTLGSCRLVNDLWSSHYIGYVLSHVIGQQPGFIVLDAAY